LTKPKPTQASSDASATMSCRQRPHRNRPTVAARTARISAWPPPEPTAQSSPATQLTVLPVTGLT
jgi:hypothetical protein